MRIIIAVRSLHIHDTLYTALFHHRVCMKFSFEFLYSFGPTHSRKIENEMILTAFNNIYTITV